MSKVNIPEEVTIDKPKPYIIIERTNYTAEQLQEIILQYYEYFYDPDESLSTPSQLVFKLDKIAYVNARKRNHSALKRAAQEIEDRDNAFIQAAQNKVGEDLPLMMQMKSGKK